MPVQLHSLVGVAHLNGKVGVLGPYGGGADRFPVTIDDRAVMVRTDNFTIPDGESTATVVERPL